MTHRNPWFFHPVFVFVFSILALASSLALYIYWYVSVSSGLQTLVRRYQLDPRDFLEAKTWMVIMVLSLLVAAILAGTLIIFIYSQKMVRLNRLQDEFINNFTHELKTPVTSLKLYLETFKRHELPRAAQLKYLAYMLQDADRLTEHINNILNLAKLEAKTYRAEFVAVELVQTVREFVQENRHIFENSDIRVHNPSGRPFRYPINQPLWSMLLMNLLANSVKYNDNPNPHLDIRFQPENKKLRISFEDNGIGIEPGETKKIFRKFYQGKHALMPAVRGTGLGLYLVQQIARLHKGKVTAANRLSDRGAAFTLTLPLPPQENE